MVFKRVEQNEIETIKKQVGRPKKEVEEFEDEHEPDNDEEDFDDEVREPKAPTNKVSARATPKVLMALPTEPIKHYEDSEGKKYDLLTVEDALTELLVRVRRIELAVGD